MRIRFLKGDPRAGMVVQVEGSLGKQHIASGAAEEVAESTNGAPATPSIEQRAIVRAAKNPAAKKPLAPAKKAPAGKAGK